MWRAWNGLGREYDIRHDWTHSADAYEHAMAAPGANTAVVLNNRGYSHLLQHQVDQAATDFVAALQKDPALAPARTNLRMALAMQGQYDRAAMTGVGDDRAAVLNNVGLAAAMRGDYGEADKLLNDAIAAKGEFYSRAAENLQLSRELAARRARRPAPSMPLAEAGRWAVVAAFTGLLIFASVSDYRWRRIPNWTVVAIAALFVPWAFLNPHNDPWALALAAGAIALTIGVVLYALGMVGPAISSCSPRSPCSWA